MFVPVVIDLIHYDRYGWLSVYYSQLDFCKKNNCPIIASEHYYETELDDTILYSVSWIERLYNIPLLSDREKKKIPHYTIPSELSKKLTEEKGSRLSMCVSLINERCEPLEELLKEYIADIKAKWDEPIEGFILYETSVKSVEYIAEKHGIPCFYVGLGALRLPVYPNMGYLSGEKIWGKDNGCAARYEKFLTEMPENTRYFTNKELLSLLLSDAYLPYLRLYGMEPSNDILVCGAYCIFPPTYAGSDLGDIEVLDDMRELYSGNYKYRRNPSDPYQAAYPARHPADPFNLSILSILTSKFVAVSSGNIIFDTMLWGRTCCCKSDTSPASFMCWKDYEPEEYEPAPLAFLNFFAFAYMIPLHLQLDAEYLHWRASNPTEKEIYEHHLKLHLKEMGIGENLLALPDGDRLKAFLYARGADVTMADPPTEISKTFPFVSNVVIGDRQYTCTDFKKKGSICSSFEFTENAPGGKIRFYPVDPVKNIKIISAKADDKQINLAVVAENGKNAFKLLNPPRNVHFLEVLWQFSGGNQNMPQNQYAQSQLNAILTSRSWKMTAPIRKFFDLLKKIIRRRR